MMLLRGFMMMRRTINVTKEGRDLHMTVVLLVSTRGEVLPPRLSPLLSVLLIEQL